MAVFKEDETYQVTILNWSKYNQRGDVKKSSWFRMEHSFFESPNFYDFNFEERAVWVYLLCEASKRAEDGRVTVNYQHAHRVGQLSATAINSAIQKLKQNKVVEVRALRGRYADVLETGPTLRNETLRNVTKRDDTLRDDPNRNTKQILSDGVEKSTLAGRDLNCKIWEAFREAYELRYHFEPTRNATVNTQISNLGKRLGQDAIEVVKFYVQHNDSFFTRDQHPIGLCLSKAEGLHTQWKRGRAVLGTEAREFERMQHNADVWDNAARVLNERKSRNGEI